jgi:hypothetical protein
MKMERKKREMNEVGIWRKVIDFIGLSRGMEGGFSHLN